MIYREDKLLKRDLLRSPILEGIRDGAALVVFLGVILVLGMLMGPTP